MPYRALENKSLLAEDSFLNKAVIHHNYIGYFDVSYNISLQILFFIMPATLLQLLRK